MRARSRHGRRTAVGVGAVLLIWPIAAVSATASTGIVPGTDRAAAVQTVLDRVLGPGGATVVVSDTIRTSSGTTTSTRFGTGTAASTATTTVVTPAGSSSSTTSQQDLVGSTTTTLADPAGTLLSQSVSVAVDRTHLGSTSVASLRKLIVSTAGVVPSRGDRVSIVVTRFARTAALVAPAVTPLASLLPYAVPAMWVAGALVALLILARALRGPRRAQKVPAGP